MKKKMTDLQRRRFLLSASLGGAGAVVIVAGAGDTATPAPATAAGAAAKPGGYSETAHVRNYYRTTRV